MCILTYLVLVFSFSSLIASAFSLRAPSSTCLSCAYNLLAFVCFLLSLPSHIASSCLVYLPLPQITPAEYKNSYRNLVFSLSSLIASSFSLRASSSWILLSRFSAIILRLSSSRKRRSLWRKRSRSLSSYSTQKTLNLQHYYFPKEYVLKLPKYLVHHPYLGKTKTTSLLSTI